MSEHSVGTSMVVRSRSRISPALVAALVVSAGLVVAGPGAGASSQPSGSPTPAAVRAAPDSGAVAAGSGNSLVVGDDGVVYGTGRNDVGQLTGSAYTTALTALTGLPPTVGGAWVATSTGGHSYYLHSLVVGDDGVVYGTGSNVVGQLTGTGDRTTLTALTGLPAGVGGVAAAAGYVHSLVVGDDGVVYGTGSSYDGQLTGTGTKATLTALTGLPAGVRGVAAAAGGVHTLVVGDDGVVYGAGLNESGQLTGTGTGDKTTLTALTGLPAGVRGIAAAGGAFHSLVVGDDGRVYGTGSNSHGQLTGTGDKTTLTALTGLPAGVRGVAAAAGYDHSLVVGDNGRVYGTGSNSHGQLTGTGDKTTLTALTGLPAGVRADVAAAGYSHSLVVGDDGVVYGTGSNGWGELTGTGEDRNTLTALALPGSVVSVTRPQVKGTPWVGRTLTATPGTWTPADPSITYRWRRNDTAIPGATNQTYRIAGGDWKQQLTVAVTAAFPGSPPATRVSAVVTVLRPPLVYAAKPTPSIEGVAQVGRRLQIGHLTNQGWTPDASRMTYQWYRGSTAIRGATARAYTPVKGDRGKAIKVVIRAVAAYYATGSFTTPKTQPVKP